VAGAVALGVCWAVELAQLSPVPAALSARSTLARLVLGSRFNVADLIWYAIGIAGMVAAHGTARWIRSRGQWPDVGGRGHG
jgi:hypothetical protein